MPNAHNYQGAGVASQGKNCRPHNDPKRWRHVQDGNTIKTFCTVCGGWIGNKPVEVQRA